jgi:hypothetical protein
MLSAGYAERPIPTHLFSGPDNGCFGRLGMDGTEIVAVMSLPKLKEWYVPLLLPLRCCDLALLQARRYKPYSIQTG